MFVPLWLAIPLLVVVGSFVDNVSLNRDVDCHDAHAEEGWGCAV